jgi:hypothetical protein
MEYNGIDRQPAKPSKGDEYAEARALARLLGT